MGAIGVVLGIAMAQFHQPAPLVLEKLPADDLAALQFAPAPGRPTVRTPPSAAAMLGLPNYPGAQVEGLGKHVYARGVPLPTAYFMTRDTPEQVLGWYERTLAEAGLLVVAHKFSAGMGYVGYLAADDGMMRMVTAVEFEQGTLVTRSSGNAEAMLLDSTSDVPADLPVPEGADPPIVYEIEEMAHTQITMVTSVPGGTLEGVTRFYADGLVAKGWTVGLVDRTQPGATRIDARQGNRQIIVSIQTSDTEPPAIRVSAVVIENA